MSSPYNPAVDPYLSKIHSILSEEVINFKSLQQFSTLTDTEGLKHCADMKKSEGVLAEGDDYLILGLSKKTLVSICLKTKEGYLIAFTSHLEII